MYGEPDTAEEKKALEEKITSHEMRKSELRVRMATRAERISGAENPTRRPWRKQERPAGDL
jgi:hypothetical protein